MATFMFLPAVIVQVLCRPGEEQARDPDFGLLCFWMLSVYPFSGVHLWTHLTKTAVDTKCQPLLTLELLGTFQCPFCWLKMKSHMFGKRVCAGFVSIPAKIPVASCCWQVIANLLSVSKDRACRKLFLSKRWVPATLKQQMK